MVSLIVFEMSVVVSACADEGEFRVESESAHQLDSSPGEPVGENDWASGLAAGLRQDRSDELVRTFPNDISIPHDSGGRQSAIPNPSQPDVFSDAPTQEDIPWSAVQVAVSPQHDRNCVNVGAAQLVWADANNRPVLLILRTTL